MRSENASPLRERVRRRTANVAQPSTRCIFVTLADACVAVPESPEEQSAGVAGAAARCPCRCREEREFVGFSAGILAVCGCGLPQGIERVLVLELRFCEVLKSS